MNYRNTRVTGRRGWGHESQEQISASFSVSDKEHRNLLCRSVCGCVQFEAAVWKEGGTGLHVDDIKTVPQLGKAVLSAISLSL